MAQNFELGDLPRVPNHTNHSATMIWLLLLGLAAMATASDVAVLTAANFDAQVDGQTRYLLELYALVQNFDLFFFFDFF